MTREETKTFLEIIQSQDALNTMEAFAGGAEIECSLNNEPNWSVTENPTWSWLHFTYRVKPQYRPYKDMAEFIAAASKAHNLVILRKKGGLWHTIKSIETDKIVLQSSFANIYTVTYEDLLRDYKWQNDTPCGILDKPSE